MKILNREWIEQTMSNGMKVILIRCPKFQRSFFLLGTGCGGLDQIQTVDGKAVSHLSGCAHFLEHRMFSLHGEDVTHRFSDLSCETNAFTGLTETAYYFSTTQDPVAPLKLLLEFVQTWEIDDKSVQREKGIILSEYDMYEQSPDSVMMKRVWESLYTTHPIRIDVLGNRNDIEQMKAEDLSRFYSINYDPSRLILVGVTGQSFHPILETIRAMSSRFTGHPDQKVKRVIFEETQEVHQPFCIESMDISIPYAAVAVKLKCPQDSKKCFLDDTAWQLTLDAYFSTLNPKLQSWIEQGILSSVYGAECEITTEYAYLVFYAQTEYPDAFYTVVEEVIQSMQKELIPDQIFLALKNRLYAQNLRVLDHFESLAIEVFQACVQGMKWTEQTEWIRQMDVNAVFERVKQYDLQHQSRILIQNNKGKVL